MSKTMTEIYLTPHITPVQKIFLEQLGFITEKEARWELGSDYPEGFYLTINHQRAKKSEVDQITDWYVNGIKICQIKKTYTNANDPVKFSIKRELIIYPQAIVYAQSLTEDMANELHILIAEQINKQISTDNHNQFIRGVKAQLEKIAEKCRHYIPGYIHNSIEKEIKELYKYGKKIKQYLNINQKKRSRNDFIMNVSSSLLNSEPSSKPKYIGSDYTVEIIKDLPELQAPITIQENEIKNIPLPPDIKLKLQTLIDEKINKLRAVVGIFYNRTLTRKKITALEDLKEIIKVDDTHIDEIATTLEHWEILNKDTVKQHRNRIFSSDKPTETSNLLDDLKKSLNMKK